MTPYFYSRLQIFLNILLYFYVTGNDVKASYKTKANPELLR